MLNSSFAKLYNRRTDAQLTDHISHCSLVKDLQFNGTAQLCNARKDSSYESFIILMLSTTSRLTLTDCFIGCISTIRIHNRSLYGGHETEGRWVD